MALECLQIIENYSYKCVMHCPKNSKCQMFMNPALLKVKISSFAHSHFCPLCVGTAPCNFETWCYSSCITFTFTNSGPDNHIEPEVWNTLNLFKFSTKFLSSSCCLPRAQARFFFSLGVTFFLVYIIYIRSFSETLILFSPSLFIQKFLPPKLLCYLLDFI